MPLTRLLLIALLSLSQPSLAQISHTERNILFFGKDQRVLQRPTQLPWAAVGQLLTRSRTICTGTLVAADVVLTAGHCFVDEKGRFDPAVSFTVGLWGKRSVASSKIAQVQVNKSFLAGLKRRADGLYIPSNIAPKDFALVRLVTPLGQSQGTLPVFQGDANALKQALAQAQWTVSLGGYPIDDQTHLRVHFNCPATALQNDGRLTHRCNTLAGNSGSPILLIDAQGAAQIIAVQSSAPTLARRQKEDNMSVSAPLFQAALAAFTASEAQAPQ